MYYNPGLKYYYYFCMCFNKYYCLLKKRKKEKKKNFYPTLVVCVQCLLFITPVYNYKGWTLLQLYSNYVMYYKFGLKHYYNFHVCFNKYYYLLKKNIYIYILASPCLKYFERILCKIQTANKVSTQQLFIIMCSHYQHI